MITEMKNEKLQVRTDLVRELRVKRGWTQSQLAEIASLSDRTIQRIETKGTASLDSLQALASAFDLEVEKLLTVNDLPEDLLSFVKDIHLLPQLKQGKYLMEIVGNAELFQFDYDEADNAETSDMIGAFLGMAQDYGEMWSDYSISRRPGISMQITNEIMDLDAAGYFVFGKQRKMVVKFPATSETPDEVKMSCAVLVIKSKSDKLIVQDKNGLHLPYLFSKKGSLQM